MWSKKHVPVVWDESYKHLQYVKQPHTSEEDIMWKSAGYTHDSYTGKMYAYPNTMPDWVDEVARFTPLKNCGHTLYRMDTLDIMPVHTDHFQKYTEVFNVSREDVRRAVIFLEDWKSGHYFEIGSEAVTNWKAGDCYIWDCDEPHAASNIGTEPRYTLQITGLYL